MEVINYIHHFHVDQIDTNKISGSKKFTNLLSEAKKYPLKRYLSFLFLKHKLKLNMARYKYVKYQIHVDDSNLTYGWVLFADNDEPLYVIISDNNEFLSYESLIENYTANEGIFRDLERTLISGLRDRKIALSVDDKISLKLLIYCIYKMFINNRVHSLIEKIIDLHKMQIGKVCGINLSFTSKVLPMMVGEALKPHDLTFDVWRNLHLMYTTTDVVINGISPNFLVGVNWCYVEDETDSANEVHAVLGGLKRLYAETEFHGGGDMEESRKKILKSIQHIQTNKLLADTSLLTVYEASQRIKTDSIFYRNIQSKVEYFDSLLFSLLYGLHVLHTRVGAVHMSLKMHDILFNLVDPDFYNNPHEAEQYTAYVMDDQSNTYFMPYNALYPVITNFNKSIINTTVNDAVIDRIMEKISDTKIKREKILHKYDTVFKAVTAIDYIRAMAALRDNSAFSSNPKYVAKIKNIEKRSEEELRRQLNGDLEETQNIGDIILKEFFSDYIYNPNNSYTVIEVYNFKANKRYSSSIATEYPEWAKGDKYDAVFDSPDVLIGGGSRVLFNDVVEIGGGGGIAIRQIN